jgi:hypothetical protein
MRKPNQQYSDYFVMDVPKGSKLSFLDEQISDTKQGVKLPEKNTTINHESNTMHVSKLPSSSVSSKAVSKTARLDVGSTFGLVALGCAMEDPGRIAAMSMTKAFGTTLLPSVGISTTLSPTTSWKNFFVFSIFANSPMADVRFEFVTLPC